MSDVIYFIQPNYESLQAIIRDFPNQDQFDYDHYGQVHLAFTHSCPDSELEKLSMHPKLATKVMSFVEANVDFEVFMDNVFTVRS